MRGIGRGLGGRPIDDRPGAGSSRVPAVIEPWRGEPLHAVGPGGSQPAIAEHLRPSVVPAGNKPVHLVVVIGKIAAVLGEQDADLGVEAKRPWLAMSARVDQSERTGIARVRIVPGNGAVESHAKHLPAEIVQRLRFVLRIIAVLQEIGVLVVLAGGHVEDPFGGMRQKTASNVLTGLVPVPFDQALLTQRGQSAGVPLARHRPTGDARAIFPLEMVGQMIGEKNVGSLGEVRMQCDPVQTAVAADIGVHPAHPPRGAGGGVDAPQVPGTPGDPSGPVRGERQVDRFRDRRRIGDELHREPGRKTDFPAEDRKQHEGGKGRDERDTAVRRGKKHGTMKR